LKRIPKQERYSLGVKIDSTLLNFLEHAYYINHLPDILKENELLKLSAQNELLILLFRIGHENAVFNMQQYLTAENYLIENGKMIGGWIKYLKSKR
jgi:hypothetical protein